MGSNAYNSHGVKIGETVQDRRDDRSQLKLRETNSILLHSGYTADRTVLHDDLKEWGRVVLVYIAYASERRESNSLPT